MSDFPKVSIVTITYGHEKYITQTLDGVLMQNYSGDIEFIIGNDNSPDDTDNVVKDYFSNKKVPNNLILKYSKHDLNKGMMPNFLWALEQTSGKYIALCEGDDFWTDPLKLQKQVDFLEKNADYGLVYTKAKMYVDSTKKFIGETGGAVNDFKDLLEYNPIPTVTVCFKRKFFESFLQKQSSINPAMGDLPLWLLIASQEKIGFINEVTGIYRIQQESASQSADIQKNINFLNAVKNIRISFLENLNQLDLIKTVEKTHYFKLSKFRLLPEQKSVSDECKFFFKKENMKSLYYIELFKQNFINNNFILNLLYKYDDLINKFLRRLV